MLVVGASLAGLRAAERLRGEGFEGELVILGDEHHRPYDRPPLSKAVLAGTMDPAMLELRERPDLGAEYVLGARASGLDLARRVVLTASGDEHPFDGLVIATGSAPRRLEALDPSRRGIHQLRTLDDALGLRRALEGATKLAIVGAGFIGIEVASTARGLGIDVELVALDAPLAIAGELISRVASEQLNDHGVAMRVGRSVTEALGEGELEGLRLDDGSVVDADVVLVAVGAAPSTQWLRGSGLQIDDGVVCDSRCAAVGVEGIVAAGDVARWAFPHPHGEALRIEHWTNAVEQASVAATTLVRGHRASEPYTPVPSFWSDHFGARVQSVGLPGLADRFEIVEGDVAERRFAAAAYRDGDLVGAVAYRLPAALIDFRSRLETMTLAGCSR